MSQSADGSPSAAASGNSLYIGIIIVLIITLISFVAYFFGTQRQIAQITSPEDLTAQIASPPVGGPASQSANLTVYQSSQLDGFAFNYNLDDWTISQEPTTADPTLILTHTDGGTLAFAFDLPWGMGGGVSTFGSGKLVSLPDQPQIYRLQGQSDGLDTYRYGIGQAVKIFADHPTAKADALKQCQDQADGVDGMYFFGQEQCSQISSGEIVGYVSQPAFDRSFTFTPLIPLGDINPDWVGDAYVDSLGNPNVIVTITYAGSTPDLADKIVSQFQSPGN